MKQQSVRAVVEALLLAAEDPVSPSRLESVLDDATPEAIGDALRSLELEYAGDARGIHLVEIAGGYQFRTNPDFGDHVRSFFESRPVRLSRAAMETLAIIAYRQPLTRAGIEEIRGVNCSGVLKTLRQCDLIDIIGRLDDIGKPHIYGTTERFLEFFGLAELGDLPTLEESELEALIDMHDDESFDDAPESTPQSAPETKDTVNSDSSDEE